MTSSVLAKLTASISELKRDPMATVLAGEGATVAILDRNEPAFYCVPVKAYEELMELLDNMELNVVADARKDMAVIKLAIDDL